MKKIAFTVTASLILSITCIIGQDLEYAKTIVRDLSSPEFQGRGYVDNGDKIAADYIENEFKTIGLKPFKKDFNQKFKIEVNIFPSDVLLEIDGVQLIPGVDYHIDPLSNSLKGSFEVIQIRKKDLLDENKLRNAVSSANGKVLLIDETGFDIEDKEKKKHADDIVNFLKYSPKISITAVVIYTNNKLTWGIAPVQSSRPSFIINKELNTQELKKLTIKVKANLINHQTQNIIGYTEGTEEPDSFLVVTAHYDHLGKMGSETYFPGANDNSSGIAMLLNMAKYYQVNPHKYSIVFIALSAEEIGLVGAKYFVDNPLFDLEHIKFLVNFDLAGTGEEGIKVVNGSVYPEKFIMLYEINTNEGYLSAVKKRGAACNSDHCMFHDRGIPCFYIYTLGGISAYHDIYDRYETLPMTKFVDYCSLMIEFFNRIE